MNKEQVVLVAGGTSGLGAALVESFARKGCCVVMNYRDEGKARVVSEKLEEAGAASRLLKVQADVADRNQVQRMFDDTIKRFDRVDVLINCAGFNRDAPFLQMTDADWDSVVGAHLKGAFICAQEFVLHNPHNRGHIINFGAACALQGRKNGVNFCSAKGGVIALTKCLALELAPRIRVNCIIPGSVDTEEVRERYHLDTPEGLNKLLGGIPLGRLGALGDVVHMTESILAAEFTTGENFFVNGGEYMQ